MLLMKEKVEYSGSLKHHSKKTVGFELQILRVTKQFKANAILKVHIALFAVLFLRCNAALAQSAQPTLNILLGRVVMVESKFDRGTAFSVDVNKREYWITAKH